MSDEQSATQSGRHARVHFFNSSLITQYSSLLLKGEPIWLETI